MSAYLRTTTPTGLGCMLLVSLGAWLFGYDNGWWGTIQGSEIFLKHYGSCSDPQDISTCTLTTSQQSTGSCVQSGGIMVGSVLAIYVNKYLGRTKSLVVTGIISIIGVVIELTSAFNQARFGQFVAGKTIAAISMGLAANIVPIYLSETSTASARGFAINMYQNVQIIGFILAAGVVYASTKRNDSAAYYIPIGLQLFAPVFMVVLSPLLPESPRWLVWNKKHDEAVKSASRIFGSKTNNFDAEAYVNELELAFEHELANPESSRWSDLFHGPDLRRLLIAVGIQCWQQAQGSGYIVNYMVPFLKDSGTTNVFPYIMGLNVVYYSGILTGHFLPDKYGRRPVIILSSLFTAIFMLVIASVNTSFRVATSGSGKASVAFLFLWQLSSGVMGPLIWIICTEAAPTRNRERVLSVALFFSFGLSLMITSVSPYLQNKGYGNLGARIGFIWGIASVLTSLWSFIMVPETKGLSLEQLDYLYEHKIPARDFSRFEFTSGVLPIETQSVDQVASEKIPGNASIRETS